MNEQERQGLFDALVAEENAMWVPILQHPPGDQIAALYVIADDLLANLKAQRELADNDVLAYALDIQIKMTENSKRVIESRL